ncbi:MAG TPA: CSLREA domain-containing protein [Thermoleophilaceae bacterium]|nr:CSLREA domain-containing protein [Thermoleophilaceae bacterium]
MRTLCTVLLAAGAVLLCLSSAAGADTFTVTKTADTADGSCDADCSLREAILDAVAGPPSGPHTIVVGAGEYQNTGSDFILGIGDQLTITGAGARTTTLREVMGGDGRVFLVEDDARLTLSGVTVTGTTSAACVLVLDDASLTASQVTFSGNSGLAGGGAIANSGGSVTLTESALSANSAASKGAGVYQSGADPSLSLTNVTISGNGAPSGAGLAVDTGTATLRNVTLAGNSGSRDLLTAAGATSIASSVVGGCDGAPVSLGFNLDAGASCGLAAAGDLSSLDPKLGAPADNGGPTNTMALDSTSPARDAGGPCPPPATDQRGLARPGGGACDIGAYEAQVSPLPPVGTRLTRLRVKRRSPKALRVSFRLDSADRVRFELMRARPGRRRAGQGCVASRRARPGARRCTRWVTLRSFSRPGAKGSNAFRMRARGLQIGRHMLKATPREGSAVFRRFRVKAFRP